MCDDFILVSRQENLEYNVHVTNKRKINPYLTCQKVATFVRKTLPRYRNSTSIEQFTSAQTPFRLYMYIK